MKKSIFILCILLVLGIASYYYVDNIFLPIQLKRFITTKAREFLQREVSVGSVDFRLMKGFVIENITIARKDDPNRPFVQIREIDFNLLFAPILKRQAVILPNVKIKDPYVYLARDKNRTWNFEDIASLAKTMKGKSSFTILLRTLQIEGGEIEYVDETQEEPFSESITNIKIDTTLSLNKGIRLILQAQIPGKRSALQIKGNYALISRKLTAQVLLENIHLAQYLPLTYTAQPAIYFYDGIISSADLRIIYKERELQVQGALAVDQADVQFGEKGRIKSVIYVPDALLTWRNKKWDAKGRLQLPSFHATADGNKEFQGDLTANLNLLTIHGNSMTSQGDVVITNAYLALDEKRHFSGDIKAANASVIKGDGTARLQGNFDIKEALFIFDEETSLKGDIATKDTDFTWSLDQEKKQTLSIQSGLTVNAAELTLPQERSISGTIIIPEASALYTPEEITGQAAGQLEAATITLTSASQFQGSPHFNIFYTYAPQDKDPLDYKGTLRFTDSLLTGLPVIGQADHIQGTVSVVPDQIQAGKLTFHTQETDIQLSGFLNNFAKPNVNITASSENITIEKILELLPSLKNKIDADLTGKAVVHASYSGFIDSPSKATVKATATLTDATVLHPRLPDLITGISGDLYYEKDLLKWRALQGTFLEKLYTSNGTLNNFSRPTIDTTLVGDLLNLTAQIKLLRSAVQFKTFYGQYLNSSFDLKGDVRLFEEDDADVDLRGNIVLNLADLGALVPRLKTHTHRLNPMGILSGEGVYKGKLRDWRNWQLTFDAKSDKIDLNGYPFENIVLYFTQRDQAISKCNATAKVYGGNFAVTSSADLRSDATPFTASIDLLNLDLSQYQKDKKTKNARLAGKLSLASTFEGKAKQWRKMTGQGALTIVEGHLWQWKTLSRLTKAVMIPEFNDSVFVGGHSDFTVKNGKILSDNVRINSKSITLNGKGWIDFDTNLNFDIIPKFSQIAIAQSKSAKKGSTSIITQTGGYLNIKLTGTLAKPNFSLEKSPMKIIGGTIGNTAETLKGVLGEIVDEIF